MRKAASVVDSRISPSPGKIRVIVMGTKSKAFLRDISFRITHNGNVCVVPRNSRAANFLENASVELMSDGKICVVIKNNLEGVNYGQ